MGDTTPSRAGIDFLLSLPRFSDQGASAYQPGLQRTRDLLHAIGNPHHAFANIHVAGTNGKGSTASMVAAIGSSLGYRMGLHTSPHLVEVTERMRVDGAPASMDWLDEQVLRHRPLLERVRPSFFEAVTAFSLLYFADAGVDWAVVEVGMGGRLDATNVLLPEVCAITRIGFDHTEHLGTTLPAIAAEKAGIVKPGRPLVLYPAPDEVKATVRAICVARNAPMHAVDEETTVEAHGLGQRDVQVSVRTPENRFDFLRVALPGSHQVENATVAIRTAELAWREEPGLGAAVRTGLATVMERSGLRGRFEMVSTEPPVIVDVAHNPDGLTRTLRQAAALAEPSEAHLFLLFAMMADKDVPTIVRLLAPVVDSVYCVSLDSPRALDAHRMAALLKQADVPVHGVGTLAEGLRMTHARVTAPQDVILVTGSHLLAGDFFRMRQAAAE